MHQYNRLQTSAKQRVSDSLEIRGSKFLSPPSDWFLASWSFINVIADLHLLPVVAPVDLYFLSHIDRLQLLLGRVAVQHIPCLFNLVFARPVVASVA